MIFRQPHSWRHADDGWEIFVDPEDGRFYCRGCLLYVDQCNALLVTTRRGNVWKRVYRDNHPYRVSTYTKGTSP
jgi:hypothetical protein